MTMAGRRLLAFACSTSTPFLNLNQNPNFFYIFDSSRHFSGFSASPEDGSFGDKFHKWHNGGGTFHESASIDSTALVEVGAVVHSESVVGSNVRIGSGTIVGPSVTIAHSTKIGYTFLSLCHIPMQLGLIISIIKVEADCEKYHYDTKVGVRYNVALSNCFIGDSCVIHNGVCIGQDGKAGFLRLLTMLRFGFYVDGDGNMIKKPQTLNVIIGNNVEIGSNTCIDRGSWRDTVIGDNSKIDNLVQIGHNVVIGKNCLLCGQVGIAGSATRLRDYGRKGSSARSCIHHIKGMHLFPDLTRLTSHSLGWLVLESGRVKSMRGIICNSMVFTKCNQEFFVFWTKPPFGSADEGRKGEMGEGRVRLAAASFVTKDIKEPGDYGGFPAVMI
ncbi:unnamed protein product [Sphenostylis stenocarpa]|uniref:Uncharacterized protein n=1 Tax=Sphenostylis stenocarpa TaxID=92480 RepID=A0AA86RZH1_9FABA|nr:unnamed protein product [Sphenostylis stenocarpa]